MGAVIMSKAKWDKAFTLAGCFDAWRVPMLQEQWSAQKLIEHMEMFLEKKAADSESEAPWFRLLAQTLRTRFSKDTWDGAAVQFISHRRTPVDSAGSENPPSQRHHL